MVTDFAKTGAMTGAVIVLGAALTAAPANSFADPAPQ